MARATKTKFVKAPKPAAGAKMTRTKRESENPDFARGVEVRGAPWSSWLAR
jgi:hypothetical protein